MRKLRWMAFSAILMVPILAAAGLIINLPKHAPRGQVVYELARAFDSFMHAPVGVRRALDIAESLPVELKFKRFVFDSGYALGRNLSCEEYCTAAGVLSFYLKYPIPRQPLGEDEYNKEFADSVVPLMKKLALQGELREKFIASFKSRWPLGCHVLAAPAFESTPEACQQHSQGPLGRMKGWIEDWTQQLSRIRRLDLNDTNSELEDVLDLIAMDREGLALVRSVRAQVDSKELVLRWATDNEEALLPFGLAALYSPSATPPLIVLRRGFPLGTLAGSLLHEMTHSQDRFAREGTLPVLLGRAQVSFRRFQIAEAAARRLERPLDLIQEWDFTPSERLELQTLSESTEREYSECVYRAEKNAHFREKEFYDRMAARFPCMASYRASFLDHTPFRYQDQEGGFFLKFLRRAWLRLARSPEDNFEENIRSYGGVD
jgi:hypothetical protein